MGVGTMSSETIVPSTGVPNAQKPARTFAPTTGIGRWAVGLGIATGIWGLIFPMFPSLLRALSVTRFPIPVGFGGATVEVLLALTAIVTGVMALRAKERAWLFYLGFAIAVAVGGFWLLFALGEVLVPH
jgi:hypothetical protein